MSVALLASGGVDSAVATHLLCERGEKPTLFYIIIGAHEDSEFSCTMEEDLEMVNLLGRQYGLEVQTVDLHRDYWDNVVAYLIDRVKRGLTPNPDVMCNSLIKFGSFYDKVGKDFDVIATGHYASTLVPERDCNLLRGGVKYLATSPDPVKDQTDFLCQITPEQLSRLEFPIGLMRKAEVRAIAEQQGLAPAHRKDSQGICFLGNTTYNALLRHYLGDKEGNIVEWESGKVLGKHQGYWYYTLGQRKGLGLGGGPWFVVSKDIDSNTVFVTREVENPELLCNATEFILNGFSFLNAQCSTLDLDNVQCFFKIRHSPDFEEGTLRYSDELGRYVISSNRWLKGVAPGQFAVVYVPYPDGRKVCIGSGEIAGKL
ncbi:MAG: tRNA 2-thiouridine(34) synthase MnmA [Bacteroidaceae bacterium]|nr:tRNA 2-thiouridine(34) synthase MnmA [Bacteroidaceae bacterium]